MVSSQPVGIPRDGFQTKYTTIIPFKLKFKSYDRNSPVRINWKKIWMSHRKILWHINKNWPLQSKIPWDVFIIWPSSTIHKNRGKRGWPALYILYLYMYPLREERTPRHHQHGAAGIRRFRIAASRASL